MMFYAHHTLPNLTACTHSPYTYILCVSEAKMAARWPPTPSPRVTATVVDSAGPIGRAHKGIDFCPRMGDGWAYLEVYAPRSIRVAIVREGSPECARCSEYFDGSRRRSEVKLRCHFRTPIFFGVWRHVQPGGPRVQCGHWHLPCVCEVISPRRGRCGLYFSGFV